MHTAWTNHACAAAIPAPGRAARLLKRVDMLLATLPNDEARRTFLDRQVEAWEGRYSRFLATEGISDVIVDANDPPQAADFLLTIAGLARRRSAFTKVPGETQMLESKRQQRIESAVRSLLVAADQRCPVIIGQAHVLYHGAVGGIGSNAEQALRQLKREAQHLLSAIADTEAEINGARLDANCPIP
jgi:hypothetical protein